VNEQGSSIGDLFKQAQDLQERLQRVQAEAGERTVEASAGGGMVRATVNGRLEVLRCRSSPARSRAATWRCCRTSLSPR
jgi:DNA-binding protein YbaB